MKNEKRIKIEDLQSVNNLLTKLSKDFLNVFNKDQYSVFDTYKTLLQNGTIMFEIEEAYEKTTSNGFTSTSNGTTGISGKSKPGLCIDSKGVNLSYYYIQYPHDLDLSSFLKIIETLRTDGVKITDVLTTEEFELLCSYKCLIVNETDKKLHLGL